jgi:hypothetical protein
MNFPANPTLNQTYTYGTRTWKWDGTTWNLQRGAAALATVASTGSFTDLVNKPTTLSGYGITDGSSLPAQTGNSGKFLTTNGTAASWATIVTSPTPAAVSDQTNTSTGALGLPVGTTAQRPANPVNGYMRYNTTTGFGEVYNAAASQWLSFGTLPGLSVEYLVVAGGGGGGCNHGGGGGAGGYLSATTSVSTSAPYTVTVGAAGSAGVSGGGGSGGAGKGGNGSNSVFNNISCTGGGGGGARNDNNNGSDPGQNGGSGGGGGGADTGYPLNRVPGNGTAGQGNNGGVAYNEYGGGGGGAGAVGGSNSGGAAAGGIGISNSISGSAVYYAGGGGAGASGGAGGLGGGGTGASSGVASSTGRTNTGGGGGGGGPNNGNGAAGGSGIVVLKYLSTFTASFTGGLTTSTVTSGSYKISTVTAGTGTVTFN